MQIVKNQMVILKFDFEKAFDKLEHNVITNILRHKGFGPKWLKWTTMIMELGTSFVLLNGVHCKSFHCKRGVRQGEPLSPILFVLVANLLRTIINKPKNLGLLKLPLTHMCGQDFPIIEYTYDTILVMEAYPRQLLFLKAMMNSFSTSIGLHVNYKKSNIYPINVSDEKMDMLARTFSYNIESFPFTYMGLPMGTTKLKLDSFLPLIQRIENDYNQLSYSCHKLAGCKWSIQCFLRSPLTFFAL
jgi:hypothetical protein